MASFADDVKTLMIGRWARYADALRACHSGDWGSFEQRVDHPPGFFEFSQRRALQECRSLARSMFRGPVVEEIELVPLWVGGLPDVDEPVAAWFAVHGKRRRGEPLQVIEPGEYFEDASVRVDTRVVCELRTWSVGVLTESRNYSPEIPLELRRGRYAVSRAAVSEAIRFEAVANDRPLPRPTVKAPPFAAWFEPRVAALPGALIDEIHDLSCTVDDEGNVVPRPSSTFVTRAGA